MGGRYGGKRREKAGNLGTQGFDAMRGGMGKELVFLTIVRFWGLGALKRAVGGVCNGSVNGGVNGVNARRGAGLKVF
jgi:hypothetical protein